MVDSDTSTMDTIHRKIEVQSMADLTYLHNNVSRSAREKIDRSFPPSAAPTDGQDGLRRRVEELVQEYIQHTFNAAKSSVSVNGMDLAEIERSTGTNQVHEEFEPFDTRLASRCTSLASEIDSMTASLARTRRTAPAQAAATFRQNFVDESAAFDAQLAKQEGDLRGRAAEEVRIDVGDSDERRWEDVERNWERGTSGLVGLNGTLGDTRARLERVKGVVEYMEGK